MKLMQIKIQHQIAHSHGHQTDTHRAMTIGVLGH